MHDEEVLTNELEAPAEVPAPAPKQRKKPGPKPGFKRKKTTAKKPSQKIEGSSLLPPEGVTVSSSRKAFWVGVTADCPVEMIDLAGINFPKVSELVIRNRHDASKTDRIPQIGSIVFLTEDKLQLMAEKLPRTIIRVIDAPTDSNERSGENTGDPVQRPRRAQLITIPSEEQKEARRKAGRPIREYVPRPGDLPAAKFMFVEVCESQERPTPRGEYPEPLSVTGLSWPND